MLKKPKILICIDWFYPGFLAGGPIKSCLNFCYALQNIYDVYVLTSNCDAGSEEPYDNVKVNTWIQFDTNIMVKYLSKSEQSFSGISNNIKTLRPDFIYLNSMFSKTFTIYPLIHKYIKKSKIKYILAPRGMLHEGALQYKNFKKQFFLKSGKTFGLFSEVQFQATDEQEQHDIEKWIKTSNQNITILPNILHISQKPFNNILKERGKLKLVYISRIAAKKNLLGLFAYLKELSSTNEVTFSIYGAVEDGQYYQECKKVISQLSHNITVTFKGPINPELVDDALKAHHLFVLPTFGENFGHAIFESLLAGRPVLISDQTPWHDLFTTKAGIEVPLKNPHAWINILEEFTMKNQDEYNEWAKNAWKYASEYLKNTDLKKEYQILFS